ncbi:DUF11 domain-containing protein [Nocardioides sp. HM23]|uniref:DUF11 domain-containing protein n=1 Tax=Nocardioides bizhenqiangii TaxID=3095076 RepID=UPI002ACA2B1F|nr:DUF11 domain-containing protein [Nocardioides sp. HM23]MDZ5623023.1 DUF11 domain-containing protein [Nocardioides sp. HM23]
MLTPTLLPPATAADVSGVATMGLNIEISQQNAVAGGSGSIPPDTMGAVGPNHIVEMINGNFEIFNKTTGASVEDRSLNSFWTNRVGVPAFTLGRVFDPRIVYDPVSERWFATVIDDDVDSTVPPDGVNEQSNNLYVGRSDTSDPTGDWDGLQIDADTVGAEEFHDYETLGLDADGLYSCTQDFVGGGNESCYSIPKADLLQATPTAANMTRFEATPAGLPATDGSWQPALDFGLSDGRAALLGSTGTALQRTNIFGAAGPGATLGTPVPIAGDPGHASPPAARQPDDADTGDGIETLENVAPRFVGNVVEVGNSLWAAHSVRGSTPNNAAVRWYEINETTNTVIQTGLIDDPNRDFHEPSITVNDHGDVVVGYTCSGPTLAASVCVSLGTTTGGVTTFQPPAILATGNGFYYNDSCNPAAPGSTCTERNRWGDYSATVIDPVDPCSFWTFQEYVSVGGTGDVGPAPDTAQSGLWGTRVTKLTFDDCVADTAVQADLGVVKECKPDVAMPAGETGICDIVVTNFGPNAAEAVKLVDRHVSNGTFEFGTITTSAGSCTSTPDPQVQQGTVTCNLGTVGAGDSVIIRVEVTADEPQDINDVATVTSTTADPDLSNNQARDGIEVIAAADLSITKTGDLNGTAGSQITYTIGVDNTGPSAARGVKVVDVLPAGVTFTSATADVGSFTLSGQVLTWNLGNVAPGDPVREIDITVKIKPNATGQLENTAEVDSTVLDPDTSNNRVTFTTAVSATAGLAITKTDTPDPVSAGQELVYTLQVSNGGPSTAVDVVVVDTLPAGTTLVSAVGGTGSTACALSGPGVVSCDVGDLDPGQSVTIFITVKVNANVPSGTVLVNTAEATSPTDPDGAEVTTETTVQTQAELWIEKTGVKPAGNPAGALVYRITVHNKAGMAPDDTPTSGAGGPSDALNVVTVDTLPLTPKKLIVQHLTPSCTYSAATHKVTCTTARVPAGTAVTYEIQVQIKGSVGSIQNRATVSSSTPDPVLDNNTDTVTNTVQGSTGKK